MIMTLTCRAPNAPDVGYLLAKNPRSVFERPFSAGTVWVFYPEVTDDQLTIALVVEVDPIGLVRGPAALAGLDQYVNDRPYVASSLISVALATAFSTAMSGHSRERSERVDERMRWEVALPAVACDGGEALIRAVFAPLGYAMDVRRLPLDERFPAWGASDLYAVRLEGDQTTRDVLTHLYVLLPVLDNAKHYHVGPEEAEKLLQRGGDWLRAHPARDVIARRYLRYRRPLVTSALAALAEGEGDIEEADGAAVAALLGEHTTGADVAPEDDAIPTEAAGADALSANRAGAEAGDADRGGGADPGKPDAAAEAVSLHTLRLTAVMDAVREARARSLVDLGCGEGRLLALALKERSLARILGMDVSTRALALARRRLRYETLPPTQRARLEIVQGSLLYRDRRLEGFDAAALVEVIEHLDPPRLGAMERVVFEHARPARVIVTTPNREYNAHWEALGTEKLRHADHRFEWTRAECQAWARRVGERHGYVARWREIGPVDPDLGAASQLVVFDRRGGAASEVGSPEQDPERGPLETNMDAPANSGQESE